MSNQHLHITAQELLNLAQNLTSSVAPEQPLILVATPKAIKLLRPLDEHSKEPDIGYIIKYLPRQPQTTTP